MNKEMINQFVNLLKSKFEAAKAYIDSHWDEFDYDGNGDDVKYKFSGQGFDDHYGQIKITMDAIVVDGEKLDTEIRILDFCIVDGFKFNGILKDHYGHILGIVAINNKSMDGLANDLLKRMGVDDSINHLPIEFIEYHQKAIKGNMTPMIWALDIAMAKYLAEKM